MNPESTAPETSETFRYWAFVSYSSRDETWGRWIHRSLENYGVPADLVNRHLTPAGPPAPRRFRPLFRDRDDLPAASDLSKKIERALQVSRYLIVVCSPHAAHSRWVNREVEIFRQMGRGDRVLAIIVSGQPNAGDERECFPPALRACEPLAADCRPGGDGKAHARLKLLAGMLGVEFDALKQRDNHRRIRRLQAVAGSALLLATAFAGLAWYARVQWTEAVRARSQAEDVLEFLVYPMRDELRKVGRLELSDRILQKVDEYYRNMGVDLRQPRNANNRGTALQNRGDALRSKGDLAGALAAYRESLATLKSSLATSTNADTLTGIVTALLRVGDVQTAAGDLPGALRSFREATDIASRATLRDPRWPGLMSEGRQKAGDTLMAQGDVTTALQEYRVALDISSRLAVSDPGNLTWLADSANAHNRVGDALAIQGDLAGALEERRSALALCEKAVGAEPDNVEAQRALWFSQLKLGDLLAAQGQGSDALSRYLAASSVIERMCAIDPSNADRQLDLAVTSEHVGDIRLRSGDVEQALQCFERKREILGRMVAADAGNAMWQRELSVSHIKVGHALAAKGDTSGALRAYRAALEISARLAAADPSHAEWARDESVAHEKAGDILATQGEMGAALSEYQAALNLSERVLAAHPDNAGAQRDVVIGLLKIASFIEKSDPAGARAWYARAYQHLLAQELRGLPRPLAQSEMDALRAKAGP